VKFFAMFATTLQQTDEQHDRIFAAFRHAAAEGWLKPDDSATVAILMLQPDFAPAEEWEALQVLTRARCKPRLKKAGFAYPSKGEYIDRLQVVPLLAGGWMVVNLSKGTEYQVSARGFALDCTCDQFGVGFCKHRDAVDEYRKQNNLPTHEQPHQATEGEDRAVGGRSQDVARVVPRLVRREPEHDRRIPEAGLPELLPGFIPTADQWAAIEDLKDWWLTDVPFFRLAGYAGTGKTTIVHAFIQWVRDGNPATSIAFTAPTNKAVKVLDRTMQRWGLDLEAMTCAKLFAIREKKVEGKQVFERDRNADPAIDIFDLVVVDECSMVSADLWDYFVEESSPLLPKQHRFILMGDPAQLPPVGEGESVTFTYPCPGAELTEVKRYGGAILALAADIRQNLDRPTLPVVTTDTDGNAGVWSLPRPDWEATMLAAFASESYANDPNYCRALAWRNKRVDYLNAKVRQTLDRVGEWEVGERVIAKEPYVVERTVMIANSEEGEVLDVRSGTCGEWDVWWLSIRREIGFEVTVPVLQRRQMAQFDAHLDDLRKAKKWGQFWSTRERFAWIAYAYALTVHKSQGSTFTHGFVDLADIAGDRSRHRRSRDGLEVYERNQLAYVALTRFEKRVFVLQ
jgi:hypothetical protein